MPVGVFGLSACLLFEDVDGAGDDQSQGDQRDQGLPEHGQLGPPGQRHDVGGAKGGGVGEREVEVVNELWLPLGVGQVGVLHLHDLEVGQHTPGVGVDRDRAAGPPRSNCQYHTAKAMMLVSQIAAPVDSR